MSKQAGVLSQSCTTQTYRQPITGYHRIGRTTGSEVRQTFDLACGLQKLLRLVQCDLAFRIDELTPQSHHRETVKCAQGASSLTGENRFQRAGYRPGIWDTWTCHTGFQVDWSRTREETNACMLAGCTSTNSREQSQIPTRWRECANTLMRVLACSPPCVSGSACSSRIVHHQAGRHAV